MIQQGHLEMVKKLLRGGAAVYQAVKDGYSPLTVASKDGHLEVARELLKVGADPTLAADNGATALGVARHFGHTRIVQLLLEHTLLWQFTAHTSIVQGGRSVERDE